jgi:hypothetical protein
MYEENSFSKDYVICHCARIDNLNLTQHVLLLTNFALYRVRQHNFLF